MKYSYEIYIGTPFVGKVTTTSDKRADDKGLENYCLLKPSSETELGGMHGIPMRVDPEHPWIFGIKSLAATVVQNYGVDYEDKVTYEAPRSMRTGCEEHGWCTQNYEKLSEEELDKFHEAAKLWIEIDGD